MEMPGGCCFSPYVGEENLCTRLVRSWCDEDLPSLGGLDCAYCVVIGLQNVEVMKTLMVCLTACRFKV